MCLKNNQLNLRPNLRVVSGQAADVLSQIHQECFPNYWDHDAFTELFTAMGTRALVVDNPDAAGMIVTRQIHEDVDILTIAVLPAHRRKGIARLLVEDAIATAKEAGAKWMFLDVEAGNTPAIALYEGLGFTHIRRRKQYYRQKDGSFTDALVMRRKLA